MRTSKKLALVAVAAVFIYIAAACGAAAKLETWAIGRITAGMALPETAETPLLSPPCSISSVAPSPSPASADSAAEKAIPTTISGGLQIKNETKYQVDIPALLKSGPSISLERASRRYSLSTPIPARPTLRPGWTNMIPAAHPARRTSG